MATRGGGRLARITLEALPSGAFPASPTRLATRFYELGHAFQASSDILPWRLCASLHALDELLDIFSRLFCKAFYGMYQSITSFFDDFFEQQSYDKPRKSKYKHFSEDIQKKHTDIPYLLLHICSNA